MSSLSKAEQILATKGQRRLTVLTAYDYPTARLIDEAGVDIILVGDSLGMVALGFPDTTQVTMEHMLHHIAAVARGANKTFIIGDLPIHSYPDPETALSNAKRLVAAGADAVKLEGGVNQAAKVKTIVDAGIPVVGHLGMLPQSVLEEGGYKKKGKTEAEAEALKADIDALSAAGVCSIVFESIVADLSTQLTAHCPVPTIGIGCGETTCDGEVVVITDLLGSYPWFVPPFARPEADLASETRRAIQAFIDRIHHG